MSDQHGIEQASESRRAATGFSPGHVAWTRGITCCAALACWLGSAACSPRDQEISAFVHDYEAAVSAAEYRVQAPDAIEISSAEAPEIDGEIQEVRQDGKISLRLLGEVKVVDMTPVEISRKLETLLRKFYVDPHVNVRLARTSSKKYYVFGQVSAPGAYPYTGRDTVLSAVAKARPNMMAWEGRIRIIHPSHVNKDRREMVIDANRMMMDGRMEHNVLVQEGDILYVPPTPLAWVGLQVQELLFPIAPIAQMFSGPQTALSAADDLKDELDEED